MAMDFIFAGLTIYEEEEGSPSTDSSRSTLNI